MKEATGRVEHPQLIGILVLPESSMMCVASVLEPFRAANRVSGEELYRWTLYSLDGNPVPLTCEVALPVDGKLEGTAAGSLLIVIGGFNQRKHVNSDNLSRIRKVSSRFEKIAGIEAGSWVLGRCGLLDGRSSTTHWEDFEAFETAFPDVELKTDRYVMDGKVMTCGGASPAFDMMLRIVRESHGHALALDVASVFVYDEARDQTDAQPLVSLGRLSERDPRISECIRLMEGHIEQPLPIAAIARRTRISVKTLENHFKAAIGLSPGKYYLGLRLGTALRFVRNSELSMQEIAVRTGFNSLSAFSRAYARHFGTTAKQARMQARTG